ncbi:FAD-dependent oxidoreductase [Pedobacter sp. SL55]|uniref:FAD-dependent oxidoreductase n=1 Tax=Pedobacter sp. SL55 TaxID=2995161 RepID=UPI00226E8A6D|nr:FAD-dependent oxidoreductase [Pedobacter sp. SL55]WAC40098.1 FAD-dependent oxidoreductase [Pedobacter sp. SL55]
MKKTLVLLLCLPVFLFAKQKEISVDVCIYGGTSAGVIAAYTAAKSGKNVIVVEPGSRLGGLSAGGLGMTDIGNKYVVSGLALDFYRKLGTHYGSFESWIFEPKVALQIFNDYIKQAKVEVLYNKQLVSAVKSGKTITEIAVANTATKTARLLKIKAKVFLDCTYEGDLMAKAGVSYFVGREDNSTYGETLSGVQLLKQHQLPDGVDPYVEKGNPSSGLLWGINNEALKPNGTGDKKVQAYNFRITLTNDPKNLVEITKPDNYDPKRYELLIRQKEIQPWKGLNDVFIWSLMPNQKTDINNRNGMSTDMIGANWDYPEADYAKRKQFIKAHEDYTKGLLYFVGNDPRIPDFIRKEMKTWGYPKDEYEDNGNWSPQLYIREARRMVSDVVMNQNHCQGREVVSDEIAFAAYTMDSHNCDRLVVNGMAKNEGNVEVGGFPPFPISYRAIVPKRNEVDNLLVPVCMSASHIAFGSIRMEPVFMVLAQSAAVAAVIAIDQKIAIQDVDVNAIKAILKSNPKADGRKPDVISSVADEKHIAITGNWEKIATKGYGKYYLVRSSASTEASVKFGFDHKAQPGKYKAYYYYPKGEKDAAEIDLELYNGKEKKSISLNLKEVKIQGQTTSIWVEIGEFDFDFSANAYLKLTNNYAKGDIAANAVLLVPNK